MHTQALEDLYTHYDMTVRNAAGGIVQFVYGDDGMDPVTMEGKGASALDFDKVLGKVCVCLCVCVRGVCTVFLGACSLCMVTTAWTL